jgi:hypothetical protein
MDLVLFEMAPNAQPPMVETRIITVYTLSFKLTNLQPYKCVPGLTLISEDG